MNYIGIIKNFVILFLITILISCSSNSKKIEASGTIEIIETNISSKNNEIVNEIFFSEGDSVKKGDVIAIINHSILDLQLIQAKSNYENAYSNYNRLKDIYASGNITLKEKEDAENKYIITKTSYEIIAKQIEDCTIISPADGVITHKLVEKGEYVNTGTPLFIVSKINPVNLTIYITEIELAKVKLGQSAKIKIDAYPEKFFLGKVIYISPNAEFTPKNIQTKEERVKQVFGVKIEIQNNEGVLKPGMPADAVLE